MEINKKIQTRSTSNPINKIILLIFLVIMILLNIFQIDNLNNNYGYGDDFAQYILQSEALFNNYTYEYSVQKKLNEISETNIGPDSYPVGYPILLNLATTFSYENFKYFKLINIIFFNFFLILNYLILKDLNNIYSFLCTLILITSKNIFLLSNSIESDLVFSTISIFIIYLVNKDNEKLFNLSIVMSSISIFFKTQGILLWFIIIFYKVKTKSLNKSSLYVFILNFLVIVVLYISKYSFLLGYYEDHYKQFSPFLKNFYYNFDVIANSLLPQSANEVMLIIFKILIFLSIMFSIKGIKNNLEIHYFYYLFFFGFYSSYLNQQGIRFLILLIPSLLWILYKIGNNFNFKLNFIYLFIGFTMLINLLSLDKNNYTLPNNAFSENSIELYDFISLQIDKQALIGFNKPRLLRLATGNNAVYPDKSSFNKIDYLITEVSLDGQYLKEINANFELLINLNKYLIFKKKNV